jgi:hypothetical protein
MCGALSSSKARAQPPGSHMSHHQATCMQSSTASLHASHRMNRAPGALQQPSSRSQHGPPARPSTQARFLSQTQARAQVPLPSHRARAFLPGPRLHQPSMPRQPVNIPPPTVFNFATFTANRSHHAAAAAARSSASASAASCTTRARSCAARACWLGSQKEASRLLSASRAICSAQRQGRPGQH